jgi:hypothetical protein
LINSRSDKYLFAQIIVQNNVHKIITTGVYDAASNEEKNKVLLHNSCDIKKFEKMIKEMTSISDEARDVIIAKDYTLLDYDNPNFSNKCILHAFAANNNIEMVKKFCEKRYNLDEKNAKKDTAAMIANNKKFIDIVQIINYYRIRSLCNFATPD